MERETGLEPATSSLGSWHSTTELLPRSGNYTQLTAKEIGGHRLRLSRPYYLLFSAWSDDKTDNTDSPLVSPLPGARCSIVTKYILSQTRVCRRRVQELEKFTIRAAP